MTVGDSGDAPRLSMPLLTIRDGPATRASLLLQATGAPERPLYFVGPEHERNARIDTFIATLAALPPDASAAELILAIDKAASTVSVRIGDWGLRLAAELLSAEGWTVADDGDHGDHEVDIDI